MVDTSALEGFDPLNVWRLREIPRLKRNLLTKMVLMETV